MLSNNNESFSWSLFSFFLFYFFLYYYYFFTALCSWCTKRVDLRCATELIEARSRSPIPEPCQPEPRFVSFVAPSLSCPKVAFRHLGVAMPKQDRQLIARSLSRSLPLCQSASFRVSGRGSWVRFLETRNVALFLLFSHCIWVFISQVSSSSYKSL